MTCSRYKLRSNQSLKKKKLLWTKYSKIEQFHIRSIPRLTQNLPDSSRSLADWFKINLTKEQFDTFQRRVQKKIQSWSGGVWSVSKDHGIVQLDGVGEFFWWLKHRNLGDQCEEIKQWIEDRYPKKKAGASWVGWVTVFLLEVMNFFFWEREGVTYIEMGRDFVKGLFNYISTSFILSFIILKIWSKRDFFLREKEILFKKRGTLEKWKFLGMTSIRNWLDKGAVSNVFPEVKKGQIGKRWNETRFFRRAGRQESSREGGKSRGRTDSKEQGEEKRICTFATEFGFFFISAALNQIVNNLGSAW